MAEQAWDLDFTGTTVESADLDNALVPDGWYRVKLSNVKDDDNNGAKILEFQILHGSLTGRKFREWLHAPRHAKDAGAAEFAKRKANCYARRLGLVDESANNRTVPRLFGDAIGKEFIVKMTTKKGDKKDFQGIDFDLYPAGHPSLKADIYPLVGLVAPPEAPKGGADEKATPRSHARDAVPVAPAKTPAELASDLWGGN